MPNIEQTNLPGIGVRHEFLASCGTRLGIITRRSGRRDLIVYDHHDPDAVETSVALSANESTALADLLGGSRVTETVSDLQQAIEGLAIDWLTLGPTSTAAGRSIADIGVRAETGVSIVAVLRHGAANPAPGPDFALEEGDAVVVVGTPEGIEAAAALLGTG